MEACLRRSLHHYNHCSGGVFNTRERSCQSQHGLKVQHLVSQEWLLMMRVRALEGVLCAPRAAVAVHPQPSQAPSSRFAAMPETNRSLSQAPADQLNPGPWSLEALSKQQEVLFPQTQQPAKLHTKTIMHRIKSASSVWGLRSAVRHVGFAFNRDCICAALSQLHHLCKQQQTQQQAPSKMDPNVYQFRSNSSSSKSSSNSSRSSSSSPATATSTSSAPLKDSTGSIASSPSLSAPPVPVGPPSSPSQLELMTDTLDCLMHYLSEKGGIAALEPMQVTSVASVLGHLLPSIPLQQPSLTLPRPPPPGHERPLPPKPCPAPPYRSSIRARLSLACDAALSVQLHFHALSARQLGMLLRGLARLGFQPSPAWCASFYRASAVQLHSVAQAQTELVHGKQKFVSVLEGHQQGSTPRGMPQAVGLVPGRGLMEVLGGSRVQVPDVEGLSGREAWAAPTPLHEDPNAKNSSSSCSSSGSGIKKHGRREQPQPQVVRALSSMLWALAHLKCPPPPAWLHANLNLTIPHLPLTQPHTLSTLAWALGILAYRPPPAFTSALLSATGALLELEQRQHADHATPLQAPPTREHGGGLTPEAAHTHSRSSSLPANPASGPEDTVHPHPSSSFLQAKPASGPEGAAYPLKVGAHWTASLRVLLLWGLAQMEVQPPAAWMEAYLEGLLIVAGAGNQVLGGREVSMLAHALAKLELKAAAQLRQQEQQQWQQQQLRRQQQQQQQLWRQQQQQQQQQHSPKSQDHGHLQLPGKQQPNTTIAQHTRILRSAPGQHQEGPHEGVPSAQPPATLLTSSVDHQQQQQKLQQVCTHPDLQSLANPKDVAPNTPHSTVQPLKASHFQLKPLGSSLLQPTFWAPSAKHGRPLNSLRPKPQPSLPMVAHMPLEAWVQAQQQQQQQQQADIRGIPCSSLSQPNPLPQQPMTPVQATNTNSNSHASSAEEAQPSGPQLWHAGSSPRGRQLLERVLAQAMGQVFMRLPECSSRSLVTLLWSLAKLRIRPHPAFLREVMALFQQRWRVQDAGNPSSNSRSYYAGNAKTRGDESQRWGPPAEAGHNLVVELDAICARSSKLVNATDTFMLAYSLASLKVKPSVVWQSHLLEAALLRLHDATPQQLANLVWSLMAMHVHPPMHWLLQMWRSLAGTQDSLGRAEQYQVAMAWLALPRTHAQRVILAQHYPRLLERILYPGSNSKEDRAITSGNAAHLSMAASVRIQAAFAAATAASAAGHVAARGEVSGALPSIDAQGAGKGARTTRQPTNWRVLARVWKEGLARRNAQHTRRFRKAGGHERAGAGGGEKGRRQTKQPMHLRVRMQRVGLAMLARRRRVGMESSLSEGWGNTSG